LESLVVKESQRQLTQSCWEALLAGDLGCQQHLPVVVPFAQHLVQAQKLAGDLGYLAADWDWLPLVVPFAQHLVEAQKLAGGLGYLAADWDWLPLVVLFAQHLAEAAELMRSMGYWLHLAEYQERLPLAVPFAQHLEAQELVDRLGYLHQRLLLSPTQLATVGNLLLLWMP